MVQDKQIKSLVISGLMKIEVGNPNAGWNEGNVTAIKKVTLPDGKRHPYISGQALRRYIRDTIAEFPEIKNEISPVEKGSDPKSPIVTKGDPEKYIDDDLFGFMRAEKKKTFRRESPLRVSPAFGIFPYKGDRDLGTRSALEVTQEAEAGGSMFETEITHNIFRTTLLLELDRVGKWKKYENTSDKEGEKGLNDRRRRVKLFIDALKYLWGGGRRSRFLIDLSPQFIISAKLTKKIPIFLNTLQVASKNDKYELSLPLLKEIINDYKSDIVGLWVGIREEFLTQTKEEIGKELKEIFNSVIVSSIGNIIEQMKQDIDKTEF